MGASKPPSLSVIVPVSDGRVVLPSSLGGLLASDLPRDRWELIVVDDGSGDGSAEVAAGWADRVVRIEGGPRGPAHARNRGAMEAKGDVLVFVDADVVVHRDTLSRFSHVFATRPDVDAVFGTYDDQPLDPGFLSQYRNLLHRYVHLRGAGEAESFWAGCGGVRRERFESLGGFDATRFPRPQIEDIELGYRMRAAGGKILLVPGIQATHLKRWTLRAIIRSDLLDRGIPWATLLFAGAGRGPGSRTLNVGWVERVKTGLLGLALAGVLVSAVTTSWGWALATAAVAAAFVALNVPTYRWFASQRGPAFAIGVIPVHLVYYLIAGVSVLAAGTAYVFRGPRRAHPPTSARQPALETATRVSKAPE